MCQKKLKKEQDKPLRFPAEKLVLDFLELHKIILIVDRINQLEEGVKGQIYIVNEKIRLRAVYGDQISKIPDKQTNGDQKKVEVVT